MNTSQLANHIIAMGDDAYLSGHPEWQSIVQEAKELIHNSENEILISWSIEDVLQQAAYDEKEITEDEARDALRFMDNNKDATLGVNWDTVSFAIEMVIEQRSTQIL